MTISLSTNQNFVTSFPNRSQGEVSNKKQPNISSGLQEFSDSCSLESSKEIYSLRERVVKSLVRGHTLGSALFGISSFALVIYHLSSRSKLDLASNYSIKRISLLSLLITVKSAYDEFKYLSQKNRSDANIKKDRIFKPKPFQEKISESLAEGFIAFSVTANSIILLSLPILYMNPGPREDFGTIYFLFMSLLFGVLETLRPFVNSYSLSLKEEFGWEFPEFLNATDISPNSKIKTLSNLQRFLSEKKLAFSEKWNQIPKKQLCLAITALSIIAIGPRLIASQATQAATVAYYQAKNFHDSMAYTTQKLPFTLFFGDTIKSSSQEEEMKRLLSLDQTADCAEILYTCDIPKEEISKHTIVYRDKLKKFHPDKFKLKTKDYERATQASQILTNALQYIRQHKNCPGQSKPVCEKYLEEIHRIKELIRPNWLYQLFGAESTCKLFSDEGNFLQDLPIDEC